MIGIRIANFLDKCPWGVKINGEDYTPCNECGEKMRGDCVGLGKGHFSHGYDNISPKLKDKIIKLIEKEGGKNIF